MLQFKFTLCSVFFFLSAFAMAQPGWTWEVLPDMPEAVSNNAVVEAISNDTLCVYSFCGIDSTLTPQGIHLKTFKYNTQSQIWAELEGAPDLQGKIAAGASYINGLIYLVGGYYVESDFSEESSNHIHCFDPNTDSWMPDAAPIPLPIDDHVQATYTDSLIYVVTGWSNSGNVADVQIFNTNSNSWFIGSPTPNNSLYKAFGPSGVIIGNEIYYHGGVSGGFSFNANSRLRKGTIDPTDPYSIEWETLEDSPGADGYRSAATSYNDRLFWIGGAGTAYNFDALAYSNNAVVEPEARILTYYSGTSIWEDNYGSPYPVMDMRGIAKVSDNEWIICGGIGVNQESLKSTYKLTYDESVSVEEKINEFNWELTNRNLVFNQPLTGEIRVYSSLGQLLTKSELNVDRFDLSSYTGHLLISVQEKTGENHFFQVLLH
ncbi:MAG: Kelch repeat-containing protein [Flavobacteriales bacterium]